MKEIKTKSTIKDIKVLDKTADVSCRAKNAYIRTKEQAEQTQRQEHDNVIEYAEDKIKDGTKTVTREAGNTVEHQGKKIIYKIKEHRSAGTDTNYTDTNDNYMGGQTSSKESNNPQIGKQNAASIKGNQTKTYKAKKSPEQNNTSIQEKQSVQQKSGIQSKVNGTAKRKYTLANTNELAKRRFVQGRAKAQLAHNREIQVKDAKVLQDNQNPVFKPAERTTWHTTKPNISGVGRTIKQAALSGRKAIKETAKSTIKTTQRSAKTVEQTVKTGVKTSQTAAKAGTKTTQSTVRTVQQTAQAARAAAQFTVRMVKLTVKAAAAMVNGLVALVGTGGAVLVLCLIIIAVAALVSSPFGIFFSSENKDAEVTPISNVVQEVNAEFDARIEKIKDDHSNVDSVEINYVGSADNTRVDNWMDVMAVFAVKTTMDKESGMDVATIDTTRIDLIKSVFWDMNLIDYYVETIEHTETETVDNGDGTISEETTTTYEHILHITITSKTAEQQSNEYDFTNDQKDIMEEMLSEEFRLMMYALLGMEADTGLTSEQLQNLYNGLPVGELGGEVVKLALSR